MLHRLSFLAIPLLLTCCVAPPPSAPAPVAVVEPPSFTQTGIASWYGPAHDGHVTASGERFDMQAMTAAHRALPFGTVLRVTRLDNGKSVTVRVNDRGPYVKTRIIDLSAKAAATLGIDKDGTTAVRVERFAADQTTAAPTDMTKSTLR
jgi:rare lipoprotein A